MVELELELFLSDPSVSTAMENWIKIYVLYIYLLG